MLTFIWVFCLILLLASLMIFIKFNKHILLILLSLEFFVVVMFYVWFVYFNLINMSHFLILYYLVFSVCESVLGLTIMIVIVRAQGSDYVSAMGVSKW
uniref:NADH-ubiquinone oxidoreductase chain 4L n=1 Tax=Janus megamaculatus TaxID=2876199 RepID=A0A8K1TMV7_9HYME|nr:NADH dehydrogenase subunit 4L [Janus megamaculatus]UGN61611.1 NADH dehydrogenase subunit 4L [Janus megamaculatus]